MGQSRNQQGSTRGVGTRQQALVGQSSNQRLTTRALGGLLPEPSPALMEAMAGDALAMMLLAEPYVTTAASTLLTAERVLTGEATVLAITDGGANSLVTVSILANGVAFAKIQQIATDRLVGRDTAGTGNLEQLTVTGGVEFSGAGGIQRSALTGDVTASAGSNTTTIANNAVSDAKLRDSAAVSVIGRSANSSGDPADIAASANDQALMRQGDALGFAVPTAGTHALWIPAQAMVPATTTGAMSGHLEMASNKNNYMTLTFSDSGAKEYAGFQIAFPKKWNEGTLTYAVYWTVNSTSTNSAVFGLQAVAVSNDDTLDVAYGTAQEVTDAGLGTAYDTHISPVSSALTIAGTPADADMVDLRFYRDSANVSDTLAVSVEVLGIKLFYTTDASTDA